MKPIRIGLSARTLLGTLLIIIGVGAISPALLDLVPGALTVHYSNDAVPGLMLIAAGGGASFVAGLWLIASGFGRRGSN